MVGLCSCYLPGGVYLETLLACEYVSFGAQTRLLETSHLLKGDAKGRRPAAQHGMVQQWEVTRSGRVVNGEIERLRLKGVRLPDQTHITK